MSTSIVVLTEVSVLIEGYVVAHPAGVVARWGWDNLSAGLQVTGLVVVTARDGVRLTAHVTAVQTAADQALVLPKLPGRIRIPTIAPV